MVEPMPLNGAVSPGRTGVNGVPAPNKFFGPHLGVAFGRAESVGWEAIETHERTLGERFLAGLPEHVAAL